MGRLDKGPSDNANTPVASLGILSPEKQAELDAHQAAVLDGIRAIQDEGARRKAAFTLFKESADILLGMAEAYPGASFWVSSIRHAFDKLGSINSTKVESS